MQFHSGYLPTVISKQPASGCGICHGGANAADLSGLPPAYIATAGHDPLRDDGARYAELLDDAGVPVELSNEPTMVHSFVSYALLVPAAAEAANRGFAALKTALA